MRWRAPRLVNWVLASIFRSTKSALYCPRPHIWEYSRVSSALFLREMSLSHCKWKSVSKVYENKTKHEQLQGKGAYVADLEIRRSMELQGAVEVVLNLGADLELRLPDSFLLLLTAEKFKGGPGLDNRPMTGPLGRPRAKYLLGGRRELTKDLLNSRLE